MPPLTRAGPDRARSALAGCPSWAPAAPRIVREEGGEAALRLPLRPQRLRRVFRGQVAAARPGGRGEMSSDTRAGVGLASRRPPIGGGRAAIRQPCSGSGRIFYCMMDLTCVGQRIAISRRAGSLGNAAAPRPRNQTLWEESKARKPEPAYQRPEGRRIYHKILVNQRYRWLSTTLPRPSVRPG